MSRENHGSSFLEGLFLGVILGGVLGVLFAPQPGKQSREWLKKVKDDNQDLIDSAVVNSENLVVSAKEAIEDGFKKVSKMIDEKMQDKKKTIKGEK